jgi:hypothetical protein
VTEISFKIDERHTVPLEPGEAAQLGLHLAVFGRDEEMPRSRRLAEKIAHAIEIACKKSPPSCSCPTSNGTTSALRSMRWSTPAEAI